MHTNTQKKQGGEYKYKGSEDMKIKRLINRLCEWLRLQGFTAEKIVECINYITK